MIYGAHSSIGRVSESGSESYGFESRWAPYKLRHYSTSRGTVCEWLKYPQLERECLINRICNRGGEWRFVDAFRFGSLTMLSAIETTDGRSDYIIVGDSVSMADFITAASVKSIASCAYESEDMATLLDACRYKHFAMSESFRALSFGDS